MHLPTVAGQLRVLAPRRRLSRYHLAGILQQGEVIVVHEARQLLLQGSADGGLGGPLRLRVDGGWVSERSGSGRTLLQPT
jgi:hypothetical protein